MEELSSTGIFEATVASLR